MHGTGDRTLRYSCSQRLYDEYGDEGERELKLFEGDDHTLTRNSREAEERLCDFIMRCAGVEIRGEERKVVRSELVDEGDRVELMQKGGDLKGDESIE